MCDCTHTGGLHLQRWQSSSAIEPQFDDDELEECLNAAELFGAHLGEHEVAVSKYPANRVFDG
jgi:hypothetical protein